MRVLHPVWIGYEIEQKCRHLLRLVPRYKASAGQHSNLLLYHHKIINEKWSADSI
ncbi:hypothetical protein [Listeria phage 184]